MAAEPTETPQAHVCPAEGCTKAYASREQLDGHINGKAPYDTAHDALLESPSKQPAVRERDSRRCTGVTSAECRAMRILSVDGWTKGELKMTMQVSTEKTVRDHLYGRCNHGHAEPPVILDD